MTEPTPKPTKNEEPRGYAEIYLSEEDQAILDAILIESAKHFDLAKDTDGQESKDD